MERSEILEKLTPLARNIFSDELLELSERSSADNVTNWTSLSFMQFLTEIETLFCVKFRMIEVLKMKDIGNIIDILIQKIR